MQSQIKLFASLLVIISCHQSLWAQSGESATITGQVYNQKRKPIPNAEVFLAYTTISTQTAGSGAYRLRNVPSGVYDLVISAKGYQIRELTITVGPSRPNRFDFRMKPRPSAKQQGPSSDEEGRAKKLNRFKEEFFSTTESSLECEILNPEVLQFPDISAKAFHAVAEEPIIFENRALGYKITYLLKEFEVDIRFAKYSGLPKFEELTPRDGEQALNWRFKRLKAYRGSLRHFFAVLERNYATQAEDNEVLRGEGFIIATILNRRKEMAEPYAVATFDHVEHRRFGVNQFLSYGEDPGEFVVAFPNYWQIRYTNELEEEGFLRAQGIQPRHRRKYERPRLDGLTDDQLQWISGDVGDQESLIKLTGESLTINSSTNHFDQAGLQIFGYWSWQRIADVLPREYTLEHARAEEIAFSNVLNQEN